MKLDRLLEWDPTGSVQEFLGGDYVSRATGILSLLMPDPEELERWNHNGAWDSMWSHARWTKDEATERLRKLLRSLP